MKRIIWMLIVVVIALAFIFYPKDAGGKYGGLIGLNDPLSITETKHDCYGFFKENKPDNTQCADCGTTYFCYGILGKKHCYYLNEELPCSIVGGK